MRVEPGVARIPSLGRDVVCEIAARLNADERVVMRAMMAVALHHQKELAQAVAEFKASAAIG